VILRDDWCFGHDEQWLNDLDDNQAVFSHDHGLYLRPSGQGSWTVAALQAQKDDRCVFLAPAQCRRC
jgi:hypothetical protein